ncbi:N-acetylmuramoyl-L-alanine amidase [Labrys wisconsinensis]|uniref:N-acetylmuramoyl-L-alanine amidase n=1 Tax=Labrys wisconsinensis TaxID=425677 RepID=A0ABU0JF11_9HYPH|nr:N-acetylmuramoyl-L-alanine amidase [Labrys wisconsinensis]MDQ0472871.1 N-acetylmuramoyl-L-alanine amidase [Labrys wisconsinensis]
MALPAPDSPVAAKVFASPNHGERAGGAMPSMLILHYTGMADSGLALQKLADPLAEVSCHYFVFEDGRVLQMVPEARRAWHAGRSAWEGETDINSRSIGIEIANPGHAWGYVAFPEAQMAAVTALCADIVRRWSIRPGHVLAHSDIAPLRKEDPGEKFDWKRLAEAGAGLWVPPAPIRGGRFFAPGDEGQPVEALQAMFAMLGYGIEVTGRYDALTEAVVRAFQRHFRQERVDGIADASTIETLRDVAAAKMAAA